MVLRYFNLKYHLFIIILFGILQINYCKFYIDNNERFYTNATVENTSIFRFRDFEPRYAAKSGSNRLFHNKRKSRGFQFYAENSDLNVELEFIVPFISIPVERSMSVTQAAFRSLSNLNFHSLLTTGAAMVAVGGIISIILKILFARHVNANDYLRKSLRNEDVYRQGTTFNQFYTSNINKLIAIVETKLHENNDNVHHCIQSSVCSYAQQSFCNSETHREGLPRIMDGIFSLETVRNYLNGTAIKTVLDTARNGNNCYKVFGDCNWSFTPNAILKMFA